MQGLWKLIRALDNDNPTRSKTVIEVNQLSTEKMAVNASVDLYKQTKSTSKDSAPNRSGKKHFQSEMETTVP